MEEIISISQKIFEREQIEKHELFERLKANSFSEQQIKFIGLQIYHVVLHFPRFLAAILSNIHDFKTRMPLVENLFEEHGRLNIAYVHSETYKTFLKGIGITEDEIKNSRPSIPVIAYNRAVTDLCLHHSFIEGLSALAVIEEIVARVSPLIGSYAKRAFTQQKESLFHFTSHETLDIEHAREIYELVDAHANEHNIETIRQGMELGMYYHRRMYSDIIGLA